MTQQIQSDQELRHEVIQAFIVIRNNHMIRGDHHRAQKVEAFLKTYYGIDLKAVDELTVKYRRQPC